MVLASAAAMVDYARSQFTLNVMQGLEERAGLLRAEVITRAIGSTGDERIALDEGRTMTAR
jgi:hypothetical protein